MKTKKLKIDRALYTQAETWAQKAGYASIEEFVAHLLEREMAHLSKEEEPEVLKERLRGLGYLS